MANIKCNGRIEIQNEFKALTAIGNGFEISDTSNVGIEIGRKDGTVGTPYIDFHTDGKQSTDFNIRLLAEAKKLAITAEDGVFVNGNKISLVDSSGNNFIRFSNGIQLCWGKKDKSNNAQYYAISFLPFYDTNYSVMATPYCSQSGNSHDHKMIMLNQSNNSTTSATIYELGTDNSTWDGYCWVAIGSWKEIKENE